MQRGQPPVKGVWPLGLLCDCLRRAYRGSGEHIRWAYLSRTLACSLLFGQAAHGAGVLIPDQHPVDDPEHVVDVAVPAPDDQRVGGRTSDRRVAVQPDPARPLGRAA